MSHINVFAQEYYNNSISREIFRNQTDFTEKGSLIWAINRTKTKFGSRMLRSWVGRPLTDDKHVALISCNNPLL